MKTSELKRFRILQDLSEEEREVVEEILEERPLSDNETLFTEGDEAEFLVLVHSGTLVISNSSETGVAEGGTSIGESSLFSFENRKVSAVSRGQSSVWLLRREDFRRLVDDHPRTAFRVAEAVLAEITGRVKRVVCP